ncbi:transposase [Escherichia coli]
MNIKQRKPRFFEKLTDSIIKHSDENEIEAKLFNLLVRNPESSGNNSYTKPNYFKDELFETYKDKAKNLNGDDDPMTPLLGHSITYRIAVGSQAGRKVFTLQTLPTSGDPFGDGIGKVAGSSLHAGVAARADERKKLERLCRYISRPAVSEKRLSLTRGGNVRYQLKTPYRDGTTHVIFEPLDFIARLAALVPKPRVNLTRFHGVFAPNSRHRALVTPAKRGRGNKVRVADEPATPAQRRASMTWAQRLKRVFNIDIETCSGCGGAMKVIACIEDPIVIKQILDHLKHKAETSGTRALPESRAPPAELLLGLFD